MPDSAWSLHPKLKEDTIDIGDLPLCKVLVIKDAHYPWLLLVPRRPGLREIHELTEPERRQLIEEIAAAGRALQMETGAAKINIGALGNLVPQLHVHVVARSAGDPAWPGPVWGQGRPEPYPPEALAAWLARLRRALAGLLADR